MKHNIHIEKVHKSLIFNLTGFHKMNTLLSVWFTKWTTRNSGVSLMTQMVKNLLTKQETQVRSLGWEDNLEKEMAPHSSILAWRIPWTEEHGGLQSVGSQNWTRLSNWHTQKNLMHFTYLKWVEIDHKISTFCIFPLSPFFPSFLLLPLLLFPISLIPLSSVSLFPHFFQAKVFP